MKIVSGSIGLCVVAAAGFALAYGQAPLYYSNQNQYFLHGLARAGHGHLEHDWLANTRDPTPVFSGLVEVASHYLPAGSFYLFHGLLQGIYFLGLAGVFACLARARATPGRLLVFMALIVAVHAAAGRWLSFRLLGLDYPWYLQTGVAAQYVLGAMFQPSAFGVLLVAAVALAAWGRFYAAVALACCAAVVHPTYWLGAGTFTLAVVYVLWSEGRRLEGLLAGLLGLALAAPVLAYTALVFGPTNLDTFAAAQAILVQVRVPHHAIVARWLDSLAGLQIAWIVIAIALSRGTRLAPLLAVPLVLSALLTLIQVATGSDFLALLFPWRYSAVLVPVATAVVLARLAMAAGLWVESWPARGAAAGAIVALALAGLAISWYGLAFQSGPEEQAVLDFIRTHASPGDVYLVPAAIPDLQRGPRGAVSSDFKPRADRRIDSRLIPPDLMRFRLATGTALYVDFKSIPYRDVEVLEWHRRLQWSEQIHRELRAGRAEGLVAELRSRGVSHIIVPAGQECPGLHMVHEDPVFRVFRVSPLATSP